MASDEDDVRVPAAVFAASPGGVAAVDSAVAVAGGGYPVVGNTVVAASSRCPSCC